MKILTIFAFAFFISAPSAQILPNLWDRILQRLLERLREPLNRQIISAIESQRVNFPVGWPRLGIAPLDPLFITEFEYQSPQIGNLANFNFRLHDGHLHGLQNFEIQHLDVRILRAAFETVVHFDELVIRGNHRTTARISVIPVSGSGDVTMRFHNVTLSAKAALAILNGGYLNFDDFHVRLQVKDASAVFTGFGLLDDAVSSAVTSSLTAIINLGEGELISRIIEGTVNALLNQVRLRDVIISIVGGLSEDLVDDNVGSGFDETFAASNVDDAEADEIGFQRIRALLETIQNV